MMRRLARGPTPNLTVTVPATVAVTVAVPVTVAVASSALLVNTARGAVIAEPSKSVPPAQWDPHEWIIDKSDLDRAPWPKMCWWLRQAECWGGVDYLQGLRWGNDIRMARGGIRAGVIGQLPDGSHGPPEKP